MAHVLDDVLVGQQSVGRLYQRPETDIDLRLSGGGHLVVLDLDRHPRLDQGQHDLGADVLQPVGRRDREIALLVPGAVAQVGDPIPARVPDPFLRVDVVVALVGVLVEAHRVEDEKLGLGAPVRGGRDPGGLEVLLGLERDEAGIAGVGLQRNRVVDVAGERERGHREHRIHEGRRHVREQQHVALVDGLEAADGRAVEAQAFPDHRFVEGGSGNRKVLPGPRQIAELHVHNLNVLLLDQVQHLLDFTARWTCELKQWAVPSSPWRSLGIGFRVVIKGSHKDDAPALNHRTQGHRVSAKVTQAKVLAVRSAVPASFAGRLPH